MVLLDLDPNLVKPGWTPLLITIAIGVVLVVLYFSMRRQFSRIDIPTSPTGATDPATPDGDSPSDPADESAPTPIADHKR